MLSTHEWMAADGRLHEFATWEAAGCPVPPPDVLKQFVVRKYGQEFGCKRLVETGSLVGGMIQATLDLFEEIISIELAQYFYDICYAKFRHHPHVRMIHGDSGTVLPELVPTFQESTLFWLDGHFSGGETAKGETDTPIREELEAVLVSPVDHIVLVDDIRGFGVWQDYPTVEWVEAFVSKVKPSYAVEIADDIMRITPERR